MNERASGRRWHLFFRDPMSSRRPSTCLTFCFFRLVPTQAGQPPAHSEERARAGGDKAGKPARSPCLRPRHLGMAASPHLLPDHPPLIFCLNLLYTDPTTVHVSVYSFSHWLPLASVTCVFLT